MLPMSTVSVVAVTACVGRATWFRSEDKTVSDVGDVCPSDASSTVTSSSSARPQNFIFLNISQV